jgi:hypothetical protein
MIFLGEVHMQVERKRCHGHGHSASRPRRGIPAFQWVLVLQWVGIPIEAE